MTRTYTDKQGQYLAFIHYYSKIHGCSPSEAEMQKYFQVSPPSVHQMVWSLLFALSPAEVIDTKDLDALSTRIAAFCHLCVDALVVSDGMMGRMI